MFYGVKTMTDQNLDKLKNSRNITLLIAVLISISALMRWLGVFGDPDSPLSPWLSTACAAIMLVASAHKHQKLTKARLAAKDKHILR